MATNGNVICRAGYGKISQLVGLPAANDALKVVILQPGHEDDQVLRDRLTLAAVLGVAQNKECTAPNYSRGTMSVAATETPDDTYNRVDSAVPDYTFPALGAMTGTNAKQDQAAVLLCYVLDQANVTNATTQVLAKYFFPFVADGSDRTVPFSTGFVRAAGA